MAVLQDFGSVGLTTDTAYTAAENMFTADAPYLFEVTATNMTADDKSVDVFVVHDGDTSWDQYGWIVRSLPLPGNNAYTTIRFAVNNGDSIHVSGSADVFFRAQGMNQVA
jgi:hypothetical protein